MNGMNDTKQIFVYQLYCFIPQQYFKSLYLCSTVFVISSTDLYKSDDVIYTSQMTFF